MIFLQKLQKKKQVKTHFSLTAVIYLRITFCHKETENSKAQTLHKVRHNIGKQTKQHPASQILI